MARVLAHPFRITGSGVATVEDGSDDGLAQSVAVLVTTRRGERPLVPAFGVTDPAFGGVDMAEVNAGLVMFGPDVRVDRVVTDYPEPGVADVTVYLATEAAI